MVCRQRQVNEVFTKLEEFLIKTLFVALKYLLNIHLSPYYEQTDNFNHQYYSCIISRAGVS